MANIFTPIELDWNGKTITVRPHKVMGLISAIEDVITFPELQAYAVRGAAPVGKLSMAYARVLRYAGVRVTDEEVYAKSFSGSEEEQEAMGRAIQNLLFMMMPPEARAKVEAIMAGAEEDDGDPEPAEAQDAPGNSEATAAAS